jgi:hypothetical protein
MRPVEMEAFLVMGGSLLHLHQDLHSELFPLRWLAYRIDEVHE